MIYMQLLLPRLFSTVFIFLVMQFPIDLEQYDRREQLKKSGLGKVGLLLMM